MAKQYKRVHDIVLAHGFKMTSGEPEGVYVHKKGLKITAVRLGAYLLSPERSEPFFVETHRLDYLLTAWGYK